MKKGYSFLFIFSVILGITFFSCKLKTEEDDLYEKPAVKVANNQLMLIIPKVSRDTSYINVYRRDKNNDEIVNIGILYHPQALEGGKFYCYEDSLVYMDHTYDYRVRYKINGDYHFTEWSDDTTVTSGYSETIKLKYQANDAYFIYDNTDSTLTITGNISEPTFQEFTTEHYKPMLVVENGKSTQAFEIPSISNGHVITLKGLLPSSFLDTKIKVKGIVAQKTILENPSNQNSDITSIVWTELTPLNVNGSNNKEIEVKSQTGSSGFDYSRKVQ